MHEPNERAFPVPGYMGMEGMLLRDYFAAAAMARLVDGGCTPGEVAEWSYRHADAMLFARVPVRQPAPPVERPVEQEEQFGDGECDE